MGGLTGRLESSSAGCQPVPGSGRASAGDLPEEVSGAKEGQTMGICKGEWMWIGVKFLLHL